MRIVSVWLFAFCSKVPYLYYIQKKSGHFWQSLLFSLQFTEKLSFSEVFWGYVLPVAKEKANAKGNGDWHLRESRFCKKVMRGFLSFAPEHLRVKCFPVPFDFSARVCGEKILNMQRYFSFSTSCRQSAPKRTCVFFYCGPFCKTVSFSLWVISAALQKRRKDRGSVLSCLGLWRGVE